MISTLKIIFFRTAFGLFFVLSLQAQPKQENYSLIFSDDYQRANAFLQNEKWIGKQIESHELKIKEVTAIFFPELIRYSSLQDKVETFALETLYVQYGKEYANFSVGPFQIKPSFAEAIEIDFMKSFGKEKLLNEFKIQVNDTLQSQDNRLKRLKRIKDKAGMVNYLCMFFKVMVSQYSNWKGEEDKIKFFASAYNCGHRKSKPEIDSFQSKKFFYQGIAARKKYSYADISWYYYQQP